MNCYPALGAGEYPFSSRWASIDLMQDQKMKDKIKKMAEEKLKNLPEKFQEFQLNAKRNDIPQGCSGIL